MKILILTSNFYPELHPRAFRANELALDFVKKGHSVKVLNLRTIVDFNYNEYSKKTNIEIINLNLYKQENKINQVSKSKNNLFLVVKKYFRIILDYFIAGNLFFYSGKIKSQFKNANNIDLIISLSNPFMNHYAVSLAKIKYKLNNPVFIADSGDPFYGSQQNLRAPYFSFLERNTYKQFDYISIPAKESVSAYINLISIKKIKIIPQGFNLKKVKLHDYKKTKTHTFAYCGVFYKDIRNPNFFLDYLISLELDFRFDIYLRHEDSNITNLLSKHKIVLKEKLNIIYGTDRDVLLTKLSSVDFLVNIDNTTTNQIPSKLIDYAITKRPIFSCNSSNFDEMKFHNFLQGDYSKSLEIDLSQYDITGITTKFINLFKEAK
jgi:hypothetical protein